jgi:NADPH2:quinone reductase
MSDFDFWKDSMRALQITSFDAEPGLASLPDRLPATGEVRIGIKACGLNFADLLMMEGRYQDTPTLPFVPGLELSGVIEAVGPDTAALPIGTRVALFSGQGGLAEAGCFPATRCFAIPDSMSFETAAAFPIAYGTSHLALTRRANLQPGETLVVTGAAGGVGLTAVEIGKKLGARVVAVARGADKLAVAKAAGADHLIDSDRADLKAELRALGSADVVYDTIGGEQFTAALGAMRPEGRILAIGFAGGTVPQIPANHLLVKNVSVMGFYWGGYLKFQPQALTDSLSTLVGWFEDGKLNPHVSHVLPLDRVAEGLALLRNRKSTGKVVIRCDQSA